MLAQRNRFHGHGSLRFLYKNGRSIRSSLITLKYITNPRRKHCRITVVVGKKVVKSAVRRNRIRRRVYEVVRRELSTIKDGHDMALMVFSAEVYSMEHRALEEAIKQLLSQANLYK